MKQASLCPRASLTLLALLAFCAWTLTFGVSSVQAETETWEIRSNYPNQVHLEFYSEDRKGHVWPGGGEVYVLKDSRLHSYPLTCQPGEKICWGAWVSGTGSRYWGKGQDAKHSCIGCCWTCGRKGEPRAINLN
jgi:hypothetical protein